jgi:XTP/dITP diphosphohydrolase
VTPLRIGTSNLGKLREFEQMLAPLGFAVRGLDDLPGFSVEEDGLTFEANAIKEARAVCASTGEPALADDSGLVVDALEGRPGVHSARFAPPDADDQDEANRRRLLEEMRDVPDGSRSARFVCVLAYVEPNGLVQTFKGTFEGSIGREPRGTNGFGYDSLFVVRGDTRTSAELPSAQKNALSHRGEALRALLAWLQSRSV